MKVERCPICNTYCVGARYYYKDSDGWNGRKWHAGCGHKTFYGITKIGVTLRWNRWARSEARRIAEEGKGK